MLSQAGVQSLRFLLADPRLDPAEVDWTAARETAAAAGVIVRLADAVRVYGEPLPAAFAARAAMACRRTQWVLEIADALGARCRALGIEHVLLRVAERYPDSGAITLLLPAASGASSRLALDRTILRYIPAVLRRRAWDRLAGVSSYTTTYDVPLRLRHGRLGRFGEHARHARMLIDRARLVSVGPSTIRAPAPEDHLTLLAIERSYMRPAVHLDDLAWAIPAIRAPSFDWDYLFAAAVSIGMRESVGAFLAYVNGVYEQVFTTPVISPAVLGRFRPASHPTSTRRIAEPFPVRGTVARSYVRHLGATLESGRWQSAARLSLLPFVAARALWRSS